MRRRLVLVAAATTSMVAVAFVVPLALLVRQAAVERALGAARQATQVLVPTLAAGNADALDVAVAAAGGQVSGDVTVYLPDGTVAGSPAPADGDVARARGGEAFVAEVTDGLAVLTPVLTSAGDYAVVRVGLPREALTAGVVRAWTILGGVGAVLVGAAVVVSDRLARSTLAPIRDAAAAARRLAAGELTARASVGGPEEVAEVATALNVLAARIDDLLDAEREAAADLSHRLRTPLTALALEVEALPPSAGRERLTGLVGDLERATDRLIRASRRAGTSRGREGTADVGEVARQRLAFWSVLAEDQGRRWSAQTAAGALARVDAEDLAAAVDALLANVVAHTPDGAGFRVEVVPDGEMVRLRVSDEGPGFPDGDVVLRGVSRAGSTGLGLDIVRRTAEAHGGWMAAANLPGGGASVEMVLPAATADRRRPGRGDTAKV